MGSRNLFCVRSKSRSPSAERFNCCIAHVGNRAHLISSCFSCHKGRGGMGVNTTVEGEKSIWKLGTYVGNGFTKSLRSQWSFPKAERKYVFLSSMTPILHDIHTCSYHRRRSEPFSGHRKRFLRPQTNSFITISSDTVWTHSLVVSISLAAITIN